MDEQAGGHPPTPEQARKLAELEALGVPTDALRRIIEERPQDFEREANAVLRRELLGEDVPAAQPSSEPVRISGAAPVEPAPEEPPPQPEAPSEVAPDFGTSPPPLEIDTTAPEPPPPDLGASPELPPNEVPMESIDDLEAKLAAYVAGTPPAPAEFPTPAVLEDPAGSAANLDAAVSAALAEALAEAPPVGADDPPLAAGDEMSFDAPAPQPIAVEAGAKPPPPTGKASPAVSATRPPERVVVKGTASPQGARPVAAAAGATEVLPAQEPTRKRFGKTAAGVAVVVLVLAGTYFFLVNTAPVPAFSFSPLAPIAGEPVLFSASDTTDPNGDPITFRWQFGDGTANASGRSVSHTFPSSGNFAVILTATDDHRNSETITKSVAVAAGTISPPLYRYGDSLGYALSGRSHVQGAFAPLATVNFTFAGFSGSCDITAVDLNFEGPQGRTLLPDAATALDGFLQPHDTYVVERSLANLQLLGQVNVSGCPVSQVAFSGSATVLERAFQTPLNNDTVRGETTESLSVTVETDPPRVYDSEATLTDFPALASAAEQLHFESVYAGKTFSTEGVSSGAFTAEGLHWLWITQGTALIDGSLALKIHFSPDNLPPASVYELTVDLWVSSFSSFPLREVYHVRGVDSGRSYESTFDAQGVGVPVIGVAAVPFATGARSYASANATEFAPLTQVPRSTAGADFAFTARTAFDEGVLNCSDVASFMAANPNAYAVNATYSRSTGNPKWTLDLSQDPSGESKRIEDEHSTSTQVRCPSGAQTAKNSRASIGQIVSLNYAADLMKREPTAAALFPASAFDALHANFTVRQELHLPSLSLNAALMASRASVMYAFGAESLPSQTERTSAYVDAKTGQLVYVLRDRGDRLP